MGEGAIPPVSVFLNESEAKTGRSTEAAAKRNLQHLPLLRTIPVNSLLFHGLDAKVHVFREGIQEYKK